MLRAIVRYRRDHVLLKVRGVSAGVDRRTGGLLSGVIGVHAGKCFVVDLADLNFIDSGNACSRETADRAELVATGPMDPAVVEQIIQAAGEESVKENTLWELHKQTARAK